MIRKILLTLLEMNSDTVLVRTGKKAPVSGVYRSEKEYIALTKGETLPPAFDSFWRLVVKV